MSDIKKQLLERIRTSDLTFVTTLHRALVPQHKTLVENKLRRLEFRENEDEETVVEVSGLPVT